MAIYGQDNIFLQRREKSDRTKKLKLNREYTIKTHDTTYFSKIVGHTDTTLSFTKSVKGKDTTYTISQYGKTRDTTIVRSLWVDDTVKILFTDIEYIQKDWFANRQWLEPFGYLAVGAALGVAILPLAAAFKGVEGVKDWAEFEGIILAVSVPPLVLGTIKTKYDLKTKWSIHTKQ